MRIPYWNYWPRWLNEVSVLKNSVFWTLGVPAWSLGVVSTGWNKNFQTDSTTGMSSHLCWTTLYLNKDSPKWNIDLLKTKQKRVSIVIDKVSSRLWFCSRRTEGTATVCSLSIHVRGAVVGSVLWRGRTVNMVGMCDIIVCQHRLL